MVSDVPVGAFLSGGLDSSLLVAMLAKRIGVRDLPTFTIGLPYQRFR
jgi:asparagine synthase (glutamine-hydrolysing)